MSSDSTSRHDYSIIKSENSSTMVFDSFKATFASRRRRRASASLLEVPPLRYEDLPQTTPPPLMREHPLKATLLPGIPSLKPLTISNLLAIGRDPTDNASTMAERTSSGSSTSPPQSINARPVNPGGGQHKRVITIPRKPVGLPDDPRRASYVPSFDPQAPRKNANLHSYARKVLLRRYQSKFTFPADFIPYGSTANVNEYRFLWVKPGELEDKVLEDIIWVRERFAYARKEEPTDADLIRWYEAELFDDGSEGDFHPSWEFIAKEADYKLKMFQMKKDKEAEEAAMDRASIEVNLGEEAIL